MIGIGVEPAADQNNRPFRLRMAIDFRMMKPFNKWIRYRQRIFFCKRGNQAQKVLHILLSYTAECKKKVISI